MQKTKSTQRTNYIFFLSCAIHFQSVVSIPTLRFHYCKLWPIVFSKNIFHNVVIPFLYIPSLLTFLRIYNASTLPQLRCLALSFCFSLHCSTEKQYLPVSKSNNTFSTSILKSSLRYVASSTISIWENRNSVLQQCISPFSLINHSQCSSRTHF